MQGVPAGAKIHFPWLFWSYLFLKILHIYIAFIKNLHPCNKQWSVQEGLILQCELLKFSSQNKLFLKSLQEKKKQCYLELLVFFLGFKLPIKGI